MKKNNQLIKPILFATFSCIIFIFFCAGIHISINITKALLKKVINSKHKSAGKRSSENVRYVLEGTTSSGENVYCVSYAKDGVVCFDELPEGTYTIVEKPINLM